MTTQDRVGCGVIKIEDSPSPEPFVLSAGPSPVSHTIPAPIDPRDPEGFLKRCSGFNKKTKLRCSSVIGKNSQRDCHPTFLPTCRAHRDQQTFAGWCQYQHRDGERCSRLFRWTPPYFELCSNHQGHPDTPCYFFKLPLELRHEVLRYLLPTTSIGSSTAALHDGEGDIFDHAYASTGTGYGHSRYHRNYGYQPAMTLIPRTGGTGSVFPVPLLDLFLVNRQFYQEAKDLLFSTVPFTIDVRKDGTFMCGRRLLEPRRADGSSHYLVDEADEAKQKFLKTFDWCAVKHYSIDILVENYADHTPYPNHTAWDEEVELYDIRDYVSVVVSGVLAKSRNLCKLQVRLCLADFEWPHEQILVNTKLIVGPFELLRNVRQPQILGLFMGRPAHNSMLTVQRPARASGSMAPICSVPPLPTHTPVMIPGMPDFDKCAGAWAQWISSSDISPIASKPPIRKMFTDFKDFYSKLSEVVPDVKYRFGRHAFLHRARVAREQEDVKSFRHLRNELIQYWYAYVEQEERKKYAMNARLSRMLDADTYPSHEWEAPSSNTQRSLSTPQKSSQSPVVLNPYNMVEEGIPMAGNPRKQRPTRQEVQCMIPPAQSPTSMPPPASVVSGAGQVLVPQAQQQHNHQAKDATVSPATDAAWSSVFTSAEDVHTATLDDDLYNNNTSNVQLVDSPDCQIDDVDVGCFAHVNLSSDWYASNGEPGPSSKKRRVDSGFSEMSTPSDAVVSFDIGGTDHVSSYVGKGKGKLGVEMIYLD